MNDLAFVTEDDGEEAAALQWQPTWRVLVGESEVGVTIDDGCVVFLARNDVKWVPMTHVPALAIQFVANLLAKAG